MKRENLIKRVADTSMTWDVVVVGGGATGLGVAVDAATRGFSVLCLNWMILLKQLQAVVQS